MSKYSILLSVTLREGIIFSSADSVCSSGFTEICSSTGWITSSFVMSIVELSLSITKTMSSSCSCWFSSWSVSEFSSFSDCLSSWISTSVTFISRMESSNSVCSSCFSEFSISCSGSGSSVITSGSSISCNISSAGRISFSCSVSNIISSFPIISICGESCVSKSLEEISECSRLLKFSSCLFSFWFSESVWAVSSCSKSIAGLSKISVVSWVFFEAHEIVKIEQKQVIMNKNFFMEQLLLFR